MKNNKYTLRVLVISVLVLLFNCSNSDPGIDSPTQRYKPVVKTNTMKVYMHYMPWFQSKSVSGFWGSHWRMNTRNPDIIDVDGKREIASHYYPLIGPYDSKDPDVIEYHLLLMKYAGIDGILFDWYGSHSFYDYGANLINTNAVVDKLDDVGLLFGMVYEDYTAGAIADQTGKSDITYAQEDMAYLQTNYFSNKEHININDKPLLLTFGPRRFTQQSQWTSIMTGLTIKPQFLPLWFQRSKAGSNATGEFAWVDFTSDLSNLTNFYKNKSQFDVMLGAGYPRFHDYYKEGGTGESYGYVDFDNGQTLRHTLSKATEYSLDYLQLVTWNDFGEGTVIEPTVEDQFLCLEIIQEFTGVSYGKPELELIYTYYLDKVKYKDNTDAQAKLKQVFNHLTNLEVDQAKALLDQL